MLLKDSTRAKKRLKKMSPQKKSARKKIQELKQISVQSVPVPPPTKSSPNNTNKFDPALGDSSATLGNLKLSPISNFKESPNIQQQSTPLDIAWNLSGKSKRKFKLTPDRPAVNVNAFKLESEFDKNKRSLGEVDNSLKLMTKFNQQSGKKRRDQGEVHTDNESEPIYNFSLKKYGGIVRRTEPKEDSEPPKENLFEAFMNMSRDSLAENIDFTVEPPHRMQTNPKKQRVSRMSKLRNMGELAPKSPKKSKKKKVLPPRNKRKVHSLAGLKSTASPISVKTARSKNILPNLIAEPSVQSVSYYRSPPSKKFTQFGVANKTPSPPTKMNKEQVLDGTFKYPQSYRERNYSRSVRSYSHSYQGRPHSYSRHQGRNIAIETNLRREKAPLRLKSQKKKENIHFSFANQSGIFRRPQRSLSERRRISSLPLNGLERVSNRYFNTSNHNYAQRSSVQSMSKARKPAARRYSQERAYHSTRAYKSQIPLPARIPRTIPDIPLPAPGTISTTRSKIFEAGANDDMVLKIANEDGNEDEYEIVKVEKIQHVHTNVEIPIQPPQRYLPPLPHKIAHNPFKTSTTKVIHQLSQPQPIQSNRRYVPRKMVITSNATFGMRSQSLGSLPETQVKYPQKQNYAQQKTQDFSFVHSSVLSRYQNPNVQNPQARARQVSFEQGQGLLQSIVQVKTTQLRRNQSAKPRRREITNEKRRIVGDGKKPSNPLKPSISKIEKDDPENIPIDNSADVHTPTAVSIKDKEKEEEEEGFFQSQTDFKVFITPDRRPLLAKIAEEIKSEVKNSQQLKVKQDKVMELETGNQASEVDKKIEPKSVRIKGFD